MKSIKFYIGLSVSNGNILEEQIRNENTIELFDKVVNVRANALRIIQQFTDGFTVFDGAGQWKGISEPCIVVECLCESLPVAEICDKIKKECLQDAVIVTITELNFYEL